MPVAKATTAVVSPGVATQAGAAAMSRFSPVPTAAIPAPRSVSRVLRMPSLAGYQSRAGVQIIEKHGYIPHVVDRRQEADGRRRNAKKKARRWVAEVCHSWFSRFRKLLVRYEKLKRSFMALNHLAAAIIAFRKVPANINIICG